MDGLWRGREDGREDMLIESFVTIHRTKGYSQYNITM
jgi:hypothetical protein